ncbi:hypothetical protein PAXRUDRAFT_767446 [Paxillus rubicundulus Ve08.2h10]|uniref:Alkyl hydroperoxide reductase subunit C/ Thiol specific antioxidant domain-containing protein n=1 Tax=Paxillus rubicundulus Ve08.2h10 TaxID=930991 RepID=A0A0D0E6F1_9AGAM|nr:hypothetical protein PAXRUDRAFT_767446 [Paxillus rubicundulus Ve08.2h10]
MTLHPLTNKGALSFLLPDANGQTFEFPPEEGGKHVGKPIALFFYPESGTYDCTRAARQFCDALAGAYRFKQGFRSDVLVIGVSSDPAEKQKAFVEKHKLAASLSVDFLRGSGRMGTWWT